MRGFGDETIISFGGKVLSHIKGAVALESTTHNFVTPHSIRKRKWTTCCKLIFLDKTCFQNGFFFFSFFAPLFPRNLQYENDDLILEWLYVNQMSCLIIFIGYCIY